MLWNYDIYKRITYLLLPSYIMIRKQHGTFVWNVLLFADSGNIFQNKIGMNLPTLHYLIDSNPLKGKSPQFWLIFIENLTAGICLLSNPNHKLWQKRAAIIMKSYLNGNIPTIKVQILWVCHKIWKNLPHYLVMSKWAFFSNFYGHNSEFECCSANYESYQTDCFATSYKSTLQIWLFWRDFAKSQTRSAAI